MQRLMQRLWHILAGHEWWATDRMAWEWVGSLEVCVEQIRCACGATRWEITHRSVRYHLERGGR